MKSDDFAKGTERLIDPITVGSIHFLQQFYGLLSRRLQQRLMNRAAQTTPFMGFVVEPYSFFLCYEVADDQLATTLLPEGFRLAHAIDFATLSSFSVGSVRTACVASTVITLLVVIVLILALVIT